MGELGIVGLDKQIRMRLDMGFESELHAPATMVDIVPPIVRDYPEEREPPEIEDDSAMLDMISEGCPNFDREDE